MNGSINTACSKKFCVDLASRIRFLIVFFVTFLTFSASLASAGLLSFVESAKRLQIKSLKQTIINKNKLLFEGEVEVFIDRSMHLWADRVEVDKASKTLVAEITTSAAIKIENKDFIILADKFFLNLDKTTGYADNIKIHVLEGYISAGKAEKLGENEWGMRNILYTACDNASAHWTLTARKAVVHGGYFIRVSGVLFKIGSIPIFALPKMAFPIQGKSRSGFLMPKLYFDYDNGFGFKQEYYHYIASRCDTTLGVDWRDKKGVVFSDEFRWARAPENFTLFNGHYAISRNTFTQHEGKIFKSTRRRYWVAGKDFQSNEGILGAKVSSLVRADFGTDKRIGYQFFNKTEDVDDAFYNSWVMRGLWLQDLVELRLDDTKTSRKRFSDLDAQDKKDVQLFAEELKQKGEIIEQSPFQKKELENRVTVTQLPHLEWNSAYRVFGDFLSYRHDASVDYIYYRERESEKLYFQSNLAKEERIIPLSKAHVIRANYRGFLEQSYTVEGNALSFMVHPNVQLRSRIAKDCYLQKNVFEQRAFAYGASRFFLDYGAEWALPEHFMHSKNYGYFHVFQPVVRWDYVPRFNQDHWYYMDAWDRSYSKNQVELALRNNWMIDNVGIDIQFSQAYDFYDPAVRFPLRRATGKDKYLLPFQVQLGVSSENVDFSLNQEYGFIERTLLHSDAMLGFKVGKVKIDLGYLYQHYTMQEERGLLSNIPHFALLSIALPVSKHGMVHYVGQFYSEQGPHFFEFSNIKPFLHGVRFEYNGHCWGFYVGFEEKKYREYGNNKHERAFVFSLRLDSLGSFAKKIRQPQIIREVS